MIVYKVPGKNAGPEGKTYDWLGIEKGDLDKKLEEGWFKTLEEAVSFKPVSPRGERLRAREEDGQYKADDPSTPDVNEAYVSDDAPTRGEMEAKANELGIKFHKNIADKKLVKLIEKELAKV